MDITLQQLIKIIPTNKTPDVWLMYINRLCPKYGIDTPYRLAGFLSQAAVESNELNILFENLNYSATRLTQVWPNRFPSVQFASQYANNPQRLANFVYANRMGNGDVASGDGWKFRGRGIKQLTGRNNYTAFANYIQKTVEEAVVYAGTKEGAVESACWYWKTNNLNQYADKGDITGLTKAINGGLNGINERKQYWIKALSALSAKATPTSTQNVTLTPIGIKDTGELVMQAQQKLGISADGIFGPKTQQAVRQWQKSNHYPVSGYLTIKQLEDLLNA